MPVLSVVAALALRLLAQVGIAVSAPPEVGPRDPVLVKVEVTAPAGRDVRLDVPSFAPFRLLSAMRVASVDTVPPGGGYLRAPWQVVEFRYVLSAPGDAGGGRRYSFGAFVAHVTAPGMRPAILRSREWQVAIRGTPPQPQVPAIVSRVSPRAEAGISFHALATPDTVYVGQQATYQVAVFLDDDVRSRLRRNPEFLPPELRSMLAYDLPAGRASLRGQMIAGRSYDVHVFQRAVFPLSAGRVAIPPAQLSYSLPLSSGFFSREESYTARSEPASVIAIDPPAAGRPAEWQGAVGVLDAAARIDTAQARAGDAIVYTLRVEGTGNVKLLPRPRLTIPWASAVESDERVTVDSGALMVRGAKEFDWILTPRDTGTLRTPELRYAFFDPYDRRYGTAVAPPIEVHVGPGSLAETPGDSAVRGPLLPIRRSFGGAAPAPLPSRPLFWALVLLVPLPALATMLVRRPRGGAAAAPRSGRQRLDELARGGRRDPAADVRDVRRAFVAALGERLAIGPDVRARRGALARLLRRRGLTAETAAEVEDAIAALDERAYAAGAARADAREAAVTARALFRRVDAEACTLETIATRTARVVPTGGPATRGRRHPGARARAVSAVLLLAVATGGAAGALGAADADRAAAAFDRGVRAYEARRFAVARQAFDSAAAAEPRSPDAWANLGTAAWVTGDTVAAAVGWQRALRLDPTGSDVRARLPLLPASQDGWIAGVPRVAPDSALAVAAALWTLGWLAAARRAARSRRRGAHEGRWVAHLAAGALTSAAAVAVSAAALRDFTRLDRVAVVSVAGPLRTEPVLGAETTSPVERTDVARMGARMGAWVRVELDGGRAGWMEMDRLVPLGG